MSRFYIAIGVALWASSLTFARANDPGTGSVPAFEAEDAASLDAARTAFEAGRYALAARLAETQASADGLALAARARMAECGLALDRADAPWLWAEAARLARQALSLDPDHVEARLQLASALWAEGRTLAPLVAFRRGLARQGRDLLEEALELEALQRGERGVNAWPHAMLAGWHFEVRRKAGALGGAMMRASRSDGVALCTNAIALESDNPAIAAQCALSLFALDETGGDEVSAWLSHALMLSPRTQFEAVMMARAAEIVALLSSEKETEAYQKIAIWLGE